MRRIHDYAVIGDGRSAALVSDEGSIDWLCWPRFDSASLFGRIVDDQAGYFSLRPVAPFRVQRRYLEDTNVLVTRMITDRGVVELTDLMPVSGEGEKRGFLQPEHEVLRRVRCVAGEVELALCIDVRPDYGRRRVRPRNAGALGVRFPTPVGLLFLNTDFPVDLDDEGRGRACFSLRAGETRHASLSLAYDEPAVIPPVGEWSEQAIERTTDWWRGWLEQMEYEGPHEAEVKRAALTLKLLVFAPSGAIIAAPTTSLPEQLGGSLNWDYRYPWLRDASMTARALAGLGFSEELEAYSSWLLHTTRLTQPRLSILYDVFGRDPGGEVLLDHLAGHRGSRPVRVGNAAVNQLQLDVYGEVIEAACRAAADAGGLDRTTARLLTSLGEYVCRNWNRPDEGIWEPRSGRAHHTHSRLLCWNALDRVLSLERDGLMPSLSPRFAENLGMVAREIRERAWSDEKRSYTATLDGDHVDAALLLLSWYEFEDAGSDRMLATHERIQQDLKAGEGLLYRYPQEPGSEEGAFGICCFWVAEHLARGGGTLEEAEQLLDKLCEYSNDVGLYGEEIHPETGEALGNFPQGFTHIGLINAALTLERRRRASERGVAVPTAFRARQGAA